MALSASAVLILSGLGFVLVVEKFAGGDEAGAVAGDRTRQVFEHRGEVDGRSRDDSRALVEELRDEAKILAYRIDALADRVSKLTAKNRLLTARFKSLETDFGTVTGSIDLMMEKNEPPKTETGRGSQPGDPEPRKSVHRKETATSGRRADRIGDDRRDEARERPPRPEVRQRITDLGRDGIPGDEARRGRTREYGRDVAAAVAPGARAEFKKPTRTEFALKLATYSRLSGLRQVWRGLQIEHRDLLGDLLPRTVLKEAHGDTVRIDLLAGPLLNAAEATAVCAKLTAAGSSCEPDIYRGEPLKVD